MDPSLKFACYEILRRLDEFDTRMERRFSRTMAALEQRGIASKLRDDTLERSPAPQF